MLAHEIFTFDDPPVNEVALGRTFLHRPDFLLPYFGGYWQRVSAKYPKVEHAAPIVDPTTLSGDQYFLPRVWLVSSDSTTLLQVQQDRLHFNWRQSDAGNPYVRFPVVQAEFLDAWNAFEMYLKETTGQPVQPVNAELVYVNIISLDGVKDTVSLLERSLRDFKLDAGPRFLPRPGGANVMLSYGIPDSKNTFKVSTAAVKRKKTGEPALKLELSVTGKCPGDASFEEWSSKAHDFLVQGFKDLTTTEMHKAWKFKA